MSQVFPKSANAWSKASLITVIFGVLGLGWVILAIQRSDFVYFNHSIHVTKGVGCETCHGRVDKMPLMLQKSSLQMEWCLDCHRDPSKFVRPLDQITTMGYVPAVAQAELGPQLVKQYQISGVEHMTSCSVCHR